MAVRAKFVVSCLTRKRWAGSNEDQWHVELYPVTGDTPEDKSFWKSTPVGKIELGILNTAASDQFSEWYGKKVYVTFELAPD
jgi:hypothetical protein